MFYGEKDQETVINTVVFDVNETFDGFSSFVDKEDNFSLEIH